MTAHRDLSRRSRASGTRAQSEKTLAPAWKGEYNGRRIAGYPESMFIMGHRSKRAFPPNSVLSVVTRLDNYDEWMRAMMVGHNGENAPVR